MKSILNIGQIWLIELFDTFRDRGILIFILFVPLVYPLLYSYVYTNEVVRDVPAVVVDENNTHLSRQLIRNIDASPDVKVIARCADMAEAELYLKRQDAYGIIQIPDRFTRDLYRGDQTTVALFSDMASMLYYKAMLLTLNNVTLEMNKDIKVSQHIPSLTRHEDEVQRMPIRYAYVPLFNPQSGFASFLIPPVLMLIIQQTLLLGIGMSMGRAREHNMGCIFNADRHYKNAVHIVLGKALLYFGIYFIMAIYMYTYVNHKFGLPQLGDYGTLLAFTVPYILDCIFFSMVFSSFVFRREDCIMLFVFISVPLLFLSGVSWPGSNIPAFWRYFSYMFPSTFGMNGYVRINSMGAKLPDITFIYQSIWLQTGFYFLVAVSIYYAHIRRLIQHVHPHAHHTEEEDQTLSSSES